MRRILVTGANGQLGNAMRLLGATSRNEYRFTDVAELDITDEEAVRRAVCDGRIDVIVNCAAYTVGNVICALADVVPDLVSLFSRLADCTACFAFCFICCICIAYSGLA